MSSPEPERGIEVEREGDPSFGRRRWRAGWPGTGSRGVLADRAAPPRPLPDCRASYERSCGEREFEHWDERVAVLKGLRAPELWASWASTVRARSPRPRRRRFHNLGALLLSSGEPGGRRPRPARRSTWRSAVRDSASSWSRCPTPTGARPEARAWATQPRASGELWSAESASRARSTWGPETGRPVRAEVSTSRIAAPRSAPARRGGALATRRRASTRERRRHGLVFSDQ